jgi:hypothetical protein
MSELRIVTTRTFCGPMYVYLRSGECVEVLSASDLTVGSRDMILSRDGSPVACFDRADVYFWSRRRISTPGREMGEASPTTVCGEGEPLVFMPAMSNPRTAGSRFRGSTWVSERRRSCVSDPCSSSGVIGRV